MTNSHSDNKKNNINDLGESPASSELLSQTLDQTNQVVETVKKTQTEKEKTNLKGDDQKPVEEFVGLPLGLLIAQPFLEAVKGQQALIDAYLDTIDKLAFKEEGEESSKKTVTRTLEFDLERPVQQPDGTYSKQSVHVSAPLISLVPVPALMVDDMSVNFSMEVQSQSVDTSNHDSKLSTSTGFKGWGFNASITGEVGSSSSSSRTNSTTAKYDISVHASQQTQTEGMSKLTSLFASIIQPLPNKSAE